MQHIVPSVGRCQRGFDAEKSCTCTVQIFNLYSCVLGRIEDHSLVIRICQWSDVKAFRIKEADFSKDWTCLRHLRISHQVISAGNLQRVQTFSGLDLLQLLLIILLGSQKSVFNWFKFFKLNPDNLVGVIGTRRNQAGSGFLESTASITLTWHLAIPVLSLSSEAIELARLCETLFSLD